MIFWVAAIFLLPVSYGRPPLALAGFLVTIPDENTATCNSHYLTTGHPKLPHFRARRGENKGYVLSPFNPTGELLSSKLLNLNPKSKILGYTP